MFLRSRHFLRTPSSALARTAITSAVDVGRRVVPEEEQSSHRGAGTRVCHLPGDSATGLRTFSLLARGIELLSSKKRIRPVTRCASRSVTRAASERLAPRRVLRAAGILPGDVLELPAHAVSHAPAPS